MNGERQGIMHPGRKPLHCASGLSTRRKIIHLTEPVFSIATGSTLSPEDRAMRVNLSEPDNYDSATQSDFTYEIAAKNIPGKEVQWRWRKWPLGNQPFGTYSELYPFSNHPVEIDHGIAISFTTLRGKHDGVTWKFDAITRNPFQVHGETAFGKTMICRLPPPDVNHPNADGSHGGIQQELKIGLNVDRCFSKPIYRPIHVPNNTAFKHGSNKLNASQAAIIVDGYFSALEDYSFDIVISSPTSLKWRKYRPGTSTCTMRHEGTWCRYTTILDADFERGVYLEHGIFVKFAQKSTTRSGDRWEFTAFPCWSTSFSPVKFCGKQMTSNDNALLYVDGTLTGSEDLTFEVELLGDQGMFRWRSFVQAPNSGSDEWVHGSHMISTSPYHLEHGISIYWLTTGGKHPGDRWIWKAFSGRLVTTLATPRLSEIVPSSTNTPGGPAAPKVFGTYLGQERIRISIEIGGNCSSTCTQFRWKKERASSHNPHDVTDRQESEFSKLYEMKYPRQLAEGIYISWAVASGYAHGNAYTVTLSQTPTSVLPVRPAPSSLLSVFLNDAAGKLPARNSYFTIEFWNSSAFKWRIETSQYSKIVPVIINQPTHLTSGVSVTLSKMNGYTPGVHHLIPLRTHLARVFNITSKHHRMRERATVSMPEASLSNYMNGPNYGSMVGNVIPQIVNFGPLHLDGDPDGEVPFQQNDHVTEIKCTPGNQREPGFVASATKGYVVDSYPIVYLKIVGLPSLSNMLGVQNNEIEIFGEYSGTSSYVYEIESHKAGDYFIWRKQPLGYNDKHATSWSQVNAIPVSGSSPLDHNLSISFKSTFHAASSNKRWTFTAHKGHTFAFRVAGGAVWSEEKVITGEVQELASGISVRFSQLSGYSSGTPLVILQNHL